ncbi:MAG: energy-coupled thiamine transporter ThiT [Oscillospiraceae bacterium]|nr:energy-coupled thiamine transporter ThiT [Oscillospiraceae bacterium]
MNTKSHHELRRLAECAVFVALSLALSYLKIPIGFSFGGFGGSIDLVMIPLILVAYRWGLGWGLGAGLVFGTLKFFFAGGSAINWQSMLLDYSVAYMFVGLAGLLKRKKGLMWLGALIGCLGRFAIHFVSGVTIYAEYMEDIFGLPMTNVAVYSALYNGSYMLPNTILAVAVCIVLEKVLGKYVHGEDLKKQ